MTGDADDEARSPWGDAWARLRRNRMALAGGIFLALLAVACAAGPLFSQSFRDQNIDLGATAPSLAASGLAPTRSAATCSRARSTAGASRSRSASSPPSSPS